MATVSKTFRFSAISVKGVEVDAANKPVVGGETITLTHSAHNVVVTRVVADPVPTPTPEPTPTPTPTPTPEPTPTARALGWNLEPVYNTGAFNFANKIRGGRGWISGTYTTWDDGRQIPLDAGGYPSSLSPGQHAICLVPTHRLAEQFSITWSGTGQIQVSQIGSVVSTAQGRVEVMGDPEEDQLQLRVTSLPISNLQVRRTAKPGGWWDPTFLQSLLGSSCIRFMQWGLANGDPVNVGNTERAWTDRMPPTRLFQMPKVCYEDQIALCNAVGADIWICVPHLADDEYARQLGALVQQRLTTGRKVYVEWSNEVWNGGFAQNRYAVDQGVRLNLDPDPNAAHLKFTGKRSLEVWRAFEQGFGGRGPRVVRVLAGQCPDRNGRDDGSDEWSINQLFSLVPRGECDALAVAPYFGGGEWSFYSGPASITDILERLRTVRVPNTIVDMGVAKRMAAKLGVALVGYEGGQHIAAPDPGAIDPAVLQKLMTANRDPRMYDIYKAWIDGWSTMGGGLMCHYTHSGWWSQWGFWPALEGSGQPLASAHKARALMDWSRG